MDYQEFVALVRKMRVAHEYFRGRRESQLRTSKELERSVDEAIEEFGKGPTMFDEGTEVEHGG